MNAYSYMYSSASSWADLYCYIRITVKECQFLWLVLFLVVICFPPHLRNASSWADIIPWCGSWSWFVICKERQLFELIFTPSCDPCSAILSLFKERQLFELILLLNVICHFSGAPARRELPNSVLWPCDATSERAKPWLKKKLIPWDVLVESQVFLIIYLRFH